MMSHSDVQRICDRVHALHVPVLSLYVPVAHAPAGVRAASIRARAALGCMDVPDRIARRALRHIEETPPSSGTRVMFVRPDDVDTVDLDVTLPVVDPDRGRVEVRWGEPYTAPLELALAQSRRHGVVYVDARRARLFELFLGEIELLLESFRDPIPGVDDELQGSKQVHPAYVASRGGAAKDHAADHVRSRCRRFFRTVGGEVLALVYEHELDDVIVFGPERDVAMFEDVAPPELRVRIAARSGSLTSPDAPLDEVRARAEEITARLEARSADALVALIVERGVRGPDACLRALQRGRLEVITSVWRHDRDVYRDSVSGELTLATVSRSDRGPGQRPSIASFARVPLIDAVADQARQFGARLVVATGAAGERLARECDGIGALPRW